MKTRIEKNEAWWKSMFKKLFTIQTIVSIATILGVFIAWIAYKDNKNNTLLQIKEKKLEDKIKYHEDLVLRLGGFELKNGKKYNVAVLGAINEHNYYMFKFEIYNGGKLDAKNVQIRFDSEKPIGILQSRNMVSNRIYDERGGEIIYDCFHPNECYESVIVFNSLNAFNEKMNNCSFTCLCDNKAIPVEVELDMVLYDIKSVEEYRMFLSSHYNQKEYRKYWEGDNNFIVLYNSKEISSGKRKSDVLIYKIENNNGSTQIVSSKH